jgi:predicted dehydrogenase
MRIGVIGLGFMGSTHLKAWRNIPRAEITAVSSNNEKKLTGDLSEVGGNLGGAGEKLDFSKMKKYRTAEALIADPDIDAVDICLPTGLHEATGLAALRAGKHVLVEKPMALNGQECDHLIAEATRQKRILMVAQVLRFIPAYRAVADALNSGEYGKVRAALFRRRCAAPAWSAWLAEPSQSGGGVFDLLIHDVDFCLKLFGRPEFVSATGYEDLAAGIDSLTAHLYYADIPSVVVTGGWHHKNSYPFSMQYTIVTDGATFEFNFPPGEVTMYRADGEAEPMKLPEQDGFEAELEYFLQCCETGAKPALCPPEDSATAVKLTLTMAAAREKNGEKVECHN